MEFCRASAIVFLIWTLTTLSLGIAAADSKLNDARTMTKLKTGSLNAHPRVKNSVSQRISQIFRPNEVTAKQSPAQESRLGLLVMRKMVPLKTYVVKNKISPLYLINGTVCRYVNLQPICTTLSTTGLSVGASSGGDSSGGGGGGSNGGGSGAGGSGTSGVLGSGSVARPIAPALQQVGSSVQFANQPSRTSSLVQEDRKGPLIERLDNATSGVGAAEKTPMGVLINRRPIRLFPFRRPGQYQVLVNRREDMPREKTKIKS